MSPRAISPLKDDRSSKRVKTVSPETSDEEEDMLPQHIVDIVPGGNAVITLDCGVSARPGTPVGLRVSTQILGLASPIFKTMTTTQDNLQYLNIQMHYEDGDAMLILCNILHLRNDRLPARLSPEVLRRLGLLAQKYECTIAAGRATMQWFDRLYFEERPNDLWTIIEAAYVWDEATYFARFTKKWMLNQSLTTKSIPIGTMDETRKLAIFLTEELSKKQVLIRTDIDALVEPCAFALSNEASHYIDYPPGLSPSASETPSGRPLTSCPVDSEGAKEYLGALRSAQIWPSTSWTGPEHGRSGVTIGWLVQKMKEFKEPVYDDADRCDGCTIVKIEFTERLKEIKETQAKRLWGMCLDCFKQIAMRAMPRECRYEHEK